MSDWWSAGILALCGAIVYAQEAPPVGRPAAPSGESAAAEESRSVRVTAQGYNRDDAIKQALRKALEQGAGVQLAGFSQTENFELARDTIFSRAAGIVRDYKVLKEEEIAGGSWEVTVEAVVRPSTVAAAWGDVQNVLDQVGRPKIMVWIDETIDDQLQPQSVVETRIEELFTKAGFDLVAREGLSELQRRALDEARRERNPEKFARLAKDLGAHILIRGVARANKAGIENHYGIVAAYYNCDAQAKVYYTDTGRLIASESMPMKRAGARSRTDFSPQAARAALASVTLPRGPEQREPVLATKLIESVMEQWSTQISAGADIDLDVEGLDFNTFVDLKKALAEIERVRSVDGDFSHGLGKYRIKTLITAQNFAELLVEPPFAGAFQVVDIKPNRIQARASATPASPAPATSRPTSAPTSRPASRPIAQPPKF